MSIFIVYVFGDNGKKLYPSYRPTTNDYILKDTVVGCVAFYSRLQAEIFLQNMGVTDGFIEESSSIPKNNKVSETSWLNTQKELNE